MHMVGQSQIRGLIRTYPDCDEGVGSEKLPSGRNPDRTCAVSAAGIAFSKSDMQGIESQPARPTRCRGAEADRSGLPVPSSF
jgi:hypothetical protein